MGNWALVIGVDKYAAPHLNLKGAVRDAISMAEYLLEGPDPIIDDVNHLKLLLSLTDASPTPPSSLPALPATMANIVSAITDLARKPGGRLFVHFSGHGLMAPGLTGGEAILPEEYFPAMPIFSLSLNGIRDYLRTAHFDDQFIFIDACRNIPLEGNFNIGQFPITPKPEDMRPSVKQYVFCATSRGVKANELRMKPNEEGGAFTSGLLRGLRGEGAAKVYDGEADRYLITAGRLLRFVSSEVRQIVNKLELAPNGEFPQEPRLLGEVGDTEVTITRIPSDKISRVKLRFEIEPEAAAPTAQVQVVGDETPTAGPPINETTSIDLLQRDYRVIGTSAGFEPLKKSWPVVLYSDLQLKLQFKVAVQATRSALPPEGPPGPTSLEVWNPDSLALIRILDSKGRVIGEGRERVLLKNATPGLYRAQLLVPDGPVVEETVSVEEGDQESIMLMPSQSSIDATRLSELQRVHNLEINPDDGSMRILKTLGAIRASFVDLTGLLAMGTIAVTLGTKVVPSIDLQKLGLNAVRAFTSRRTAPATIHLVVADDSQMEDAFLKSEVALLQVNRLTIQAGKKLIPAQRLERTGVFAKAVPPGPCVLGLKTSGAGETYFSIPALANRITTLVVHRNRLGEVVASVFLSRKKEGRTEDVLLQRRLQLAQRFYRSGQFRQVLEILSTKKSDPDRELLDQHADPMAELLQAYSHLRLALGGSGEKNTNVEQHVLGARAALRALKQSFSELADVGAIAAEIAVLTKRASPPNHECRASMDHGLPLFAFGALRLLAHVNRLNIRHDNRVLLELAVNARIPGFSLTAWTVRAPS